jgi:deoxyadenosine/deoxycytidine kinase
MKKSKALTKLTRILMFLEAIEQNVVWAWFYMNLDKKVFELSAFFGQLKMHLQHLIFKNTFHQI